LRALRIPERFWSWIAASIKRGDASLYGRFDLRYDGTGPAKLLEYNADTPTACSRPRCSNGCGSSRRSSGDRPRRADQYNLLHEKLIEAWRAIGWGASCISRAMTDNPEIDGTVSYYQDCAHQAGLETALLAMADIGKTPKGAFVDLQGEPISARVQLSLGWMMARDVRAFSARRIDAMG